MSLCSQEERLFDEETTDFNEPKDPKTPRDSAMGSSTSSSTEIPVPPADTDDVMETAADPDQPVTSQDAEQPAPACSEGGYLQNDLPKAPTVTSVLSSESGICSGPGSITSYSTIKPKTITSMSEWSEDAPLLTSEPDVSQDLDATKTIEELLQTPPSSFLPQTSDTPVLSSAAQQPVITLQPEFLESMSFEPLSPASPLHAHQPQQESVKRSIKPVTLDFDLTPPATPENPAALKE